MRKKIKEIDDNKISYYDNSLSKSDNNKIIKNIKRKYLILSLVLNFGILITLKYSPLINNFLMLFGVDKPLINFGLVIPLGISFYTFQSAGYIIDVYKNKVEAQDNIFKFALFVSYFPQIIQGPISKYKDLNTQLFSYKQFDYDKLINGLQLVLWGLFKKYMIADRVAVLVSTVFDGFPESQGGLLLGAIIIYSFQIYADFSGGIDMIRGISEILQIDLIDNFNQPFFAISISDFWQRWHISLGNWMREYVFYNVALSKKVGRLNKKLKPIIGQFLYKQLPVALASTVVFVLVGMWHGPNIKFIIYGLYQAFFVVMEPLLEPIYSKIFEVTKFNKDTFSFKLFRILRTNILVTFGRFFSRADTVETAIAMQLRVLNFKNPVIYLDNIVFDWGIDMKELFVLLLSILILLTVDLLHENGLKIRKFIQEQNLIFRWILYYTFIFIIIIFGYYGPKVGSSDFIYRGF